ncbi:ISL3 family transposase [Halalkalibacterium halodurans]|nr:ISL3 family transposase [Halalkalibacterium halodurans]
MNFTMDLPGLKGVKVTKMEEREDFIALHVEMPRTPHRCPSCGERTERIHDDRIQKIQHLKLFERWVYLFYRKRRYACRCGKRFAEKACFVERYQRQTVEWNQAFRLRLIQGKNFTDTANQFQTSVTTAMRRFGQLAAPLVKKVDHLPPRIAIDDYKGDTKAGKYQVIIADADTRKPLDILPDRKADTLKRYLQEKGHHVKTVVMDLSYTFKSAVQKALGHPLIIGDPFHFCRYIYWALEGVRRRVQKAFHPYHRKRCKRIKHLFQKEREGLDDKQKKKMERYLELSPDLREAYELKEHFRRWYQEAKMQGREGRMSEVKQGLYAFYRRVEASPLKEFHRAIQTLKNWQTEILNSFAFGLNNGFIEGLNNQTKVIKRNAFGFRRYDRLRNRILLHHQFKHQTFGVG